MLVDSFYQYILRVEFRGSEVKALAMQSHVSFSISDLYIGIAISY